MKDPAAPSGNDSTRRHRVWFAFRHRRRSFPGPHDVLEKVELPSSFFDARALRDKGHVSHRCGYKPLPKARLRKSSDRSRMRGKQPPWPGPEGSPRVFDDARFFRLSHLRLFPPAAARPPLKDQFDLVLPHWRGFLFWTFRNEYPLFLKSGFEPAGDGSGSIHVGREHPFLFFPARG